MAITIVTRAGKGAPINATEFDANFTNLAAAIENLSTGHDHDGVDSKSIIADYLTYTPSGALQAVTVQDAIDELESEKLATNHTATITNATGQIAKITGKISETENATHHHYIFDIAMANYTLDAGITNSGLHCGIRSGAYILTESFCGTLDRQIGLYGRAGISVCGVGGTINTAYGGYFEILNADADGTITTAYGVYVSNTGVTGTMTNRYGLGIAAMGGAGTVAAGINVGTLSGTQTTKYGISLGAISGASTNNYGINIGNVSGGTNNYAIYTGTGNVRFGGMIDLASGQIKFPATENASADANTLDDYEEGTWTPLDSGDDTIGSGKYVKIGKIVFIYIFITANSVSTQSIKGLPFTVASSYSGLHWAHVARTDIIDADGSPCCTYMAGTTLTFKKLDGSQTNHTLTTNSTGNVRTTLQGFYLV